MRQDTDGGSADLAPVVVGREPYHRGGLFLLSLDVVSRFGKYIRTLYWRTNLSLRVEVVQRILFREPDGRRKGLVFSFFSLICILGWVYFGIVLNGPHNMLFLGVAFAFSGLAEFLPPTRQRSAGVLRILSVSILVVFLVLLILMPELIWG